jgi:hypothetical protein
MLKTRVYSAQEGTKIFHQRNYKYEECLILYFYSTLLMW